MAAHEVRDERVDGLDGIALVSHGRDLRVAFAAGAGMVGFSLTHRGEELLGQRGGLPAYRERGATFGIPLLHPWANRLAGMAYSFNGRTVELDAVAVADPPRRERAADPRAGHRLPVLARGGALARQRAGGHRGAARLRGSRGADGGLPVPPRAAHPGRAPGRHADRRDDRAVDGRRPCAGVVRLASLPAPAGRAPRRVGGRAAGAPSGRCSTNADCRPERPSPSPSRAARSATAPTTTTSPSSNGRRSSRSRAAGAGSRWSSGRATRSRRSSRRQGRTTSTSASSP